MLVLSLYRERRRNMTRFHFNDRFHTFPIEFLEAYFSVFEIRQKLLITLFESENEEMHSREDDSKSVKTSFRMEMVDVSVCFAVKR